jgi:hypothetical protein
MIIFKLCLRMGLFMLRRSIVSACVYTIGLGTMFAGPFVMSGCDGGSDKPEMVKPAEPPSVSAKDSMKNTLDNMPKKGVKAKQ